MPSAQPLVCARHPRHDTPSQRWTARGVPRAGSRDGSSPQVTGLDPIMTAEAAAAQPGAGTRKDARPIRDQPSLTYLVTRAGNGDTQERDAVVERHAPADLVYLRRHQLADADAGRVGHS
jgi:hypothetical protein